MADINKYVCKCGYYWYRSAYTAEKAPDWAAECPRCARRGKVVATEPRPTEEPTPLATAEAAREELEKFAAWMVDWFDPNEPPGAVIEAYLHDVASGWKPEA